MTDNDEKFVAALLIVAFVAGIILGVIANGYAWQKYVEQHHIEKSE